MLAKRSVAILGGRARAPRAAGAMREMDALSLSTVGDSSPVAPAASAGLQAVGRSLKAEAEQLVEKMIGMIQKIPEYRMIKDEAMWNEVRQILRVNTTVFYDAVLEGRVANEEELSAARYFARRRVHQGIPLRGHLTAYRNGMWILWGELVARVLRRPALQKELLTRAAWAFRHLETVSSAVTEAYYAEQEGRTRHRDRTLRDLFDEIINGTSASADELRSRAEAVDLKLDGVFNMVVITPLGRRPTDREAVLPSVPAAVAVAESAGLTVEQLVGVERTRELIFFVAAHGTDGHGKALRARLSEALAPASPAEPEFVVGISGQVSGVEGVRQGYKEARRAVEIGRLLERDEFVFFYEKYVLHDVLEAGSRAGQRLVSRALGALLDLGETGKRLIETLEAYFRAGSNLKVAAGLLDIHPNTLAYRMRQIHRETGLDPGDPEHRLRAEIALRLLAFQRKREEVGTRDLTPGEALVKVRSGKGSGRGGGSH